jgi:hypothetical protein
MSQADDIRSFASRNVIEPARADGQQQTTIRTGDIHQAMNLSNAMPAVCSALGSPTFELAAGVRLLSREGPKQGANVYLTFALKAPATRPSSDGAASPPSPLPSPPTRSAVVSHIDWRNALSLVSCVKTKQPKPAKAKDLYTSPWFTSARALVEAHSAHWFILSAKYGLLDPEQTVAPYELTLNKMKMGDRRTWAERTRQALRVELRRFETVIIFAGLRYRELIVPSLRAEGVRIQVPMEGLTLGQQLQWLSRAE